MDGKTDGRDKIPSILQDIAPFEAAAQKEIEAEKEEEEKEEEEDEEEEAEEGH